MNSSTHSLRLLRAMERRFTGGPTAPIGLASAAHRILWQPSKFVGSGVKRLLTSWTSRVCLVLMIALSASMLYFMQRGQLQGQLTGQHIAAALALCGIVVPAFLVLFAMPSVYGSGGATEDDIAFVVAFLKGLGPLDPKQLEPIRKCIQVYWERARSRLTILKWVCSVSWGAVAWLVLKGTEAATQRQDDSPLFLLALGATVAATAVSWWTLAYEVAVDRLFCTIEFGCSDFGYELQTKRSPTEA